ncbi:hypothetical protein, partial [Klebsiella pneumoniae]|uniref:hypothetical protein n=1 Tax=Klebsiella pneumoniae TaxID=573 RepID=UPI003F58223D
MKYSLERTVNPKTQSPGAGFFSPIAGYDEEASGKSTTLSGIEVVGIPRSLCCGWKKAKWILPATAYRPHSFCRL